MFSDIVGSTELSAQLDPEDWHAIVTRYQQTASSVIKEWDGYVMQYVGDGIIVLFGYPKAHENDAERAIRAGLALVQQIHLLNDSLQAEFKKSISVRIGIHTGEVVTGPERGDSSNIFGEAPNVAARIQTAAEPNTVCISAATQKLVAGFFVVNDLGPHILKGVPDPIQLFRVERASGVRSRLHAASGASLTPFVGREEERNALMTRWTHAQRGKGQLVMITGEAGIGKSRLLQQFKEDIGGIPHTWIAGESSQYEQDTPFAPTLDLVGKAFQWTSETPPEKKIKELEQAFLVTGLDPAKSVPLMASLFGIAVPPERYPPILLSPEQQRLQLLHTLVDWIIGISRLQPTVLVVEDLHFADPSTLEEFVMLGEKIENATLLLVFTARPAFQPPWPTRPFHTRINLNRLDADNIDQLIRGLLGRLIRKETLESLVARTDGVPLFAEELSHAIAETRGESSIEKQIPATLHDLLMTRLDNLGAGKDVAQIASVLGRTFSFSLLSIISGKPEEELQTSLAHLTESGLVFAESTFNDTIYTFKHALVQESAYGSLLKSRRRELHRAVARALKEKFPALVKQRPELAAHHLTESGDAEPAVEAWQDAGNFAAARAALVEASQHYNKALEILKTLPDTPERAQLELPILVSLGQIYSATKGFGSAEEIQLYSRARQIAEQLGDSPQFFFILLGLWSTSNSRSDLKASLELGGELLKIAERDNTPMQLAWAYFIQTLMAYEEGKFPQVESWFNKFQECYKPEDHSWAPFDPKVVGSIHFTLGFWHIGKIDRARRVNHEAYQHALTLSPSNLAMAQLCACSLMIYLRVPDAMLETAKAMQKIAEENELPSFLAWANIYTGIGNIHRGEYQAGIADIKKGLADYLASGTHSSLGQYLSILAEGYAGAGEIDKALETIQDAFGAAAQERMHHPELLRVHADILMKKPNADLEEVEAKYREAIAISQQLGSLTQELRAVTRLGYLLQSRRRADEARALLAPLYAKFTEGLDTVDLQEAKSLLNELSSAG